MTLFISTQSGAATDGGTFGNSSPGVSGVDFPDLLGGDRIVCDTSHLVSFLVSHIIGDSPTPEEDVISCNTTGGFIVLPAATLTVRGSIQGEDGDHVLSANAHVLFEVAIGLTYEWRTNKAHADLCRLVFNGTLNNRCSVTKLGLGDMHFPNQGLWDSGVPDIDYCTFTNIGNSSLESIGTRLQNVGVNYKIENCIFDNCGRLYHPNALPSASNFSLKNTTFKNTPSSRNTEFLGGINTGTKEVFHNVFDQDYRQVWPGGFEFSENYFDRVDTPSSDAAKWMGSFENNFLSLALVWVSRSPIVKDNYLYNTQNSNPHFISTPVEADSEYDGNLFEYSKTDNTGDCILPGTPSIPITVTAKRNIVLRNSNNDSAGNIVSLLGNSNITVICDNNTYYVSGDNGCPAIAESYLGHASILQSCRNNLGYSDISKGGKQINEFSTNVAVNDYITVCDFNAYSNLSEEDYDNVTAAAFAATPGANDLNDIDPGFIDEGRNLAKWAVDVLGSLEVTEDLQRTDGLNALKAMNEPSDPNFNVLALPSNLISYVKEGKAPTNVDLQGSGYDGSDRGAVPVQAGSTLLPNKINQPQAIDNINLIQHNVLSIDPITQPQAIDNIILTISSLLNINDSDQPQSMSNLDLIEHNVLGVNGIDQPQTTDSLDLIEHNILGVDSIDQPQSIDNVQLAIAGVLAIADMIQDQNVDILDLIEHGFLNISGIDQHQATDNLILTSGILLQISKIVQNQSIDNLDLTQAHILEIDKLLQNQSIENIILSVVGDKIVITLTVKSYGIDLTAKAPGIDLSIN